MKILSDVLKLTSEFLIKRGVKRYRREAEEIIRHVLGLSRIDLYMLHDRPLTEGELEKIRFYLKRRASKEPLEYLLGELEFCAQTLKIDSRVLIPRVESEILAYQIIQDLKKKARPQTVWDICCGSGCLGSLYKGACTLLRCCAKRYMSKST